MTAADVATIILAVVLLAGLFVAGFLIEMAGGGIDHDDR